MFERQLKGRGLTASKNSHNSQAALGSALAMSSDTIWYIGVLWKPYTGMSLHKAHLSSSMKSTEG